MTRYVFRGLGARKLRTALTALAVVLGVAMISGTYVLTDTIDKAFSDVFQTASQGVDVSVTGAKPSGFGSDQGSPPIDESLLPKVQGVDGVRVAEAGVFQQVSIRDKKGDSIGAGGAPNFISSNSEPPFNAFRYVEGAPPRTADQTALDQKTADDEGFKVGDKVTVVGLPGAKTYTVSGVAKFGTESSLAGAAVAITTLPEAQRMAGYQGKIDSISVAADDGVSPTELKTRVADALRGDAVAVRTGKEEADRQANDLQDQLSFLQTGLLVFAGIAVFVGAFVIYNTFSITVAQRTRELALLRTLGASRRQVLRSIVLEALVIGFGAAVVGLLGGLLIAQGLQALFKAVGADLPDTGSVIKSRTIIVALLVGTVVTVIASLAPALRSTRIAPVVALREGLVEQRGGGRIRTAIAVLLGVLGVALLLVGLFGNASGGSAAGLMGLGALVVFLAVAMLSPLLVRPLAALVGRPLQAVFGITGRLARENTLRNPGRTAVTAAALMIGVALVAFVAIFAAGLRGSIDKSVDGTFPAGNLIVVNQDGFTPISEQAATAVRDVPGVDNVAAVRFASAKVQGDTGTTPVIGIDTGAATSLYKADWKEGSAATFGQLGDDGVVVDTNSGVGKGKKVGDTLVLTTPTGEQVTYTIKGLLDAGDFSLLGGGIVVPNDRLSRDFNVKGDAFIFVDFADGANTAQTRAAVDKTLATRFPNAESQTREEFKDSQNAQLTPLLVLIYVLLALSVLVSLFGIVNTLALSTYERTRELGMMRAIGTSRRQVRSIVRQESVITSLIGAVLGVVLGVLFALLISRPLADEGFTLTFPIGTLILLLVLAALFGVLAAIGPARRAARLDVLRALAYE
jgi:putative ABC transport system permease protein